MKKLKYMIAALMLVGLVTMGASCSNMSTQQDATLACGSIGTATSVLAMQRSKLSPTEVSAVDQALAVTTPVCTAPNPPTSEQLKSQAFTAALSELTTLAAKYGSNQ
jgi:hypothetical protein